MRVRSLIDYVGNLDHRLAHLPVPPQCLDIPEKLVLIFKQFLPALAPTLKHAITEPVPSILPYKLPLPPSPEKKLRSALQGTTLPSPKLPPGAIPHTPLRHRSAAIMTVARNPGAATKTPAVTFRRHWEVLMRYTHVVDANRLTPIWIELVTVARGDFISTLEDAYRATARRLAPPVITHGVADMVREV